MENGNFLPAGTGHEFHATGNTAHRIDQCRNRQLGAIIPRFLQTDAQILAHPFDGKTEGKFTLGHRLPAIFHLPTLRRAFGNRCDDLFDIEIGAFGEVKPFREPLQQASLAARRVAAQAVSSGIPMPALCSALSYFDAFTSARLPMNLVQAQRDYFGSHTYERLDREGVFHTEWKGSDLKN